MKTYQARMNNDFAIFLTKDEQIDKFLKKGCSIYEIDEEMERVIATPEKGFLSDRPQIEAPKSITIQNDENSKLRSDIDFLAMMTGVDI